MSRRNPPARPPSQAALVVAVLAVPLSAQNLYADASWAAPVSGSYSDPAMWDPPQVPSSHEFVTFAQRAPYIVTIDSPGLENSGTHVAAGDVTWDIASGADISDEYSFYVARAGETATFRLSGLGTSTLFELFIGCGAGSHGNVFQFSGRHHTADWTIGGNGGTGTYSMAGGILSSLRMDIGVMGGTGQFVQNGGDHQNYYVWLGLDGGAGTYFLLGSAMLSTREVRIGDGVFSQTGSSTNTVKQLVHVGGKYDLTGGSLKVPEVEVSGSKGTFNFAGGTADIDTLTLTTGGRFNVAVDGNRVLPLKNLQIDAASKLDLADNKLIVSNVPAGTWDGTAYAGVAGMVDRGRGPAGNALWDGNGIVTSDTRAINIGDFVSIGVAKVGDFKNIADTATTTFAGQTVTGSDTVAMATWGGDANFDGEITIDDYGRIDANVNQSGSVFGWFNGDFNYDGKINIDDYGIIDGNVNRQGTPFSTSGKMDVVAAVPEPELVGVFSVALLCRRRRGNDI
jgi:hypothetical protein